MKKRNPGKGVKDEWQSGYTVRWPFFSGARTAVGVDPDYVLLFGLILQIRVIASERNDVFFFFFFFPSPLFSTVFPFFGYHRESSPRLVHTLGCRASCTLQLDQSKRLTFVAMRIPCPDVCALSEKFARYSFVLYSITCSLDRQGIKRIFPEVRRSLSPSSQPLHPRI